MRFAGAAGAEDDARQILDVDLMHDAGIGRNGAETGERVLAPFEERVALALRSNSSSAFFANASFAAEAVDLHGVIDDELDRLQRVDFLRIAAHLGHRVAHRGQIDDARHAGEILQQHAGRPEGDLLLVRLRRAPSAASASMSASSPTGRLRIAAGSRAESSTNTAVARAS